MPHIFRSQLQQYFPNQTPKSILGLTEDDMWDRPVILSHLLLFIDGQSIGQAAPGRLARAAPELAGVGQV
jgi:hypothetical protein